MRIQFCENNSDNQRKNHSNTHIAYWHSIACVGNILDYIDGFYIRIFKHQI